MGKNGIKIIEKQNERHNIDKLLAQKTAYSIAKNYTGLLIFITVGLPIIISISVKLIPELVDQSSYVFALFVVVATLAEKIIEKVIERLKKTAASIQEKFDTIVLDIESNVTLNTILVDEQLIRRFSKKARNDKEQLRKVSNWYSINIKDIKTNIASLLCQRTNITYDYSVRKRYKNLLLFLSVFTVSALLIISFINDLTLKTLLIEVVLPSIPIFLFVYKEYNTNTESIDNLNHLRQLIESTIDAIKMDSKLDKDLLRQIQNRIFNNRLISPLIPDFIYNILRPKLEDEMNYAVESKIKILRTK